LLARTHVPKNVQIITIGPSTTLAAHEAGLHVDGEAAGRDLEGMIEAIP
jgi:uroporphyrinogen-III synthase